MPPSSDAATWVALACAVAAMIVDVRTRRIPNVLTAAAAAIGIVMAATGASGVTARSALLGFAIGLGLMLPGHVLGGTGGGDVKLFAALGAILGHHRIVPAFIYTALAGGLVALIIAAGRGRLQSTLRGIGRLMLSRPAARAVVRAEIEDPASPNRFPYGPAIAAGVGMLALGF